MESNRKKNEDNQKEQIPRAQRVSIVESVSPAMMTMSTTSVGTMAVQLLGLGSAKSAGRECCRAGTENKVFTPTSLVTVRRIEGCL